MIAGFFLMGDDWAFMADNVAQFVAYGIGLGVIFWLLGQGISIMFRFLRY